MLHFGRRVFRGKINWCIRVSQANWWTEKWQLSTYISVKPALIWWYRLLSRKLCALSDLGWYTAQIPTWHSIHSSLRASLSTRQKSDRWLAGWFIQARNATSLHLRLSFHHLNRPQSRRINPPPVCFCLRFPLLGSGMRLCPAFAGKPIYRPFSLPSTSQQRSLSNEAGCVLWKIRPRYSNIAIWLRLRIFCDVRRCLVRRGARATSPDLLSRREKFLPLDLGVMASWRILWACTIGVVCRFCICSRIVTFDRATALASRGCPEETHLLPTDNWCNRSRWSVKIVSGRWFGLLDSLVQRIWKPRSCWCSRCLHSRR